MDPVIAVYNVKLTVRSSAIAAVGLTNDEVGTALVESLTDAVLEQIEGADEDTVSVKATSIERVDE